MARVAIVLGDGFEDSEFRVPYDRLRDAGHEVTVVGAKAGDERNGKRGKESFTPTVAADSVSASDFDALVIPGGWSPDRLRMNEQVVAFVREIGEAGKVVAAICHAGSLLIEADLVDGRRVTSYASIRTDLINAGADWEDTEVLEDANLITSRTPDDLDAFCDAILHRLAN
jgi:deglycase